MSTFTQNNARDHITLWGFGYTDIEQYEQNVAIHEETNKTPYLNAKRYHDLSTYAANRHIKYLNKKIQRKYWELREKFDKGEIGYDEWVRDIGFVHQHPRFKYPIFSIFTPNDCYSNSVKDKDPSRETIMLYRLKDDWKLVVGSWCQTTQERELRFIYQGKANARQCYLDRLTKKEKAKLDMVRMLEPDTWLDGFGGVAASNRWNSKDLIFILDIGE